MMSLHLSGHVDQGNNVRLSFRVSEMIQIQVSQSLFEIFVQIKRFLTNLTKYDKFVILNGWIENRFCLSINSLEIHFPNAYMRNCFYQKYKIFRSPIFLHDYTHYKLQLKSLQNTFMIKNFMRFHSNECC